MGDVKSSILRMVAQGRVTVEEAEALLGIAPEAPIQEETLGKQTEVEEPEADASTSPKPGTEMETDSPSE